MAFQYEDIIDIDLQCGTIHRSFINHTIGEGDNAANIYGIRAFRGNTPVNLEGANCAGYFIRPGNGDTVVIEGVTSGNTAYVTIPQACYVYEGQFSLAIKVTGAGVTGTMRIVDGVVANTTTSPLIDPGNVIPDINDLLELLEEVEGVIQGAVRFDITQELTNAQKTKARQNIGAISAADVDNLGLYIEDGYICQDITSD